MTQINDDHDNQGKKNTHPTQLVENKSSNKNPTPFLDEEEKTEALVSNPLLGMKILLYVVIFTLLIFLTWAYLSEIDERTLAQGTVIPSMGVQEVQSLEGGILKALQVKEGDFVKKDQVLMQIDDTYFSSRYQEQLSKYYALLARKTRLLAESNHQDSISFSKELTSQYQDFVQEEKLLFTSNRENIKNTLSTLKKALALAEEELAITEPLVQKKVISKLDLLKIKREVNEVQGKIQSTEKEYQSKLHDELTKTNAEIRELDENLVSLKDKQKRTTLLSPVHGVVKKINIDTLGGVIKPGEDIIEIVPIDEQLLVEGKIPPSKIAFVQPGQIADVRISAYDPNIYGSLKGKVLRVSADAIVEKDTYGRNETVYRVIVKTDRNYLAYRHEKLPIIPGMQATVSILTGKKTILDYLLKPILKAKQNALRER